MHISFVEIINQRQTEIKLITLINLIKTVLLLAT